MSSKRCPSCGEVKPVSEFPKNRSQRDGLANYCKPCHNRIIKDHKQKKYGGEDVLCFNCNEALGKFNDDPDLIQAAIHYLDAFESKSELDT